MSTALLKAHHAPLQYTPADLEEDLRAQRESRAILRFPAKNLPIAILSCRLPIGRLPTRSLHNLLHQRHGLEHEFSGTHRAAGSR
jgi:hypothetical protein